MKNKQNNFILFLPILIALANFNCSYIQSDHFFGKWIQIKDRNGNDIKNSEDPVQMKISKQGIFYIVETSSSGEFKPYGGGRYQLSDDKKYLVSFSRGVDWNIHYIEEDDVIQESAWFGFFKRATK